MKIWNYLKGKKTYTLAFATVVYAALGWYTGALDASTALQTAIGGLGMATLRHGM